MASSTTSGNWSVKILRIPSSITLARLTKALNLPRQYRVVIPKTENKSSRYAWINGFTKEEDAKEFESQWSGASIFGWTIRCSARASRLQEKTASDHRRLREPQFYTEPQGTGNHSTSSFPSASKAPKTDGWRVKIIGLPQNISEGDLAARLQLSPSSIVIPLHQQDHSYRFAWLNDFPTQQEAEIFAAQWNGKFMEPESEIKIRCKLRPPGTENEEDNTSGRSSPDFTIISLEEVNFGKLSSAIGTHEYFELKKEHLRELMGLASRSCVAPG